MMVWCESDIKATFSVRCMTFHNKSIGHSKSFMITISPTYLFIWKELTFVGLCVAFSSIFLIKKTPTRLPMQIT